MSASEAARRWSRTHTFPHTAFPEALPTTRRAPSISVCLPAGEEATTIGPIVAALVGLRERGVIDERGGVHVHNRRRSLPVMSYASPSPVGATVAQEHCEAGAAA